MFGNRRCTLARELTKLHEEFLRGTIEEILEVVNELKGEMVIVVEGNTMDPQEAVTEEVLLQKVEEYIESGMKASMAVKEVSKETGVSKNRIYELVHRTKE